MLQILTIKFLFEVRVGLLLLTHVTH